MYAYIYIYVCIYIYIYIYIYVYVYVLIDMFVSGFICLFVCLFMLIVFFCQVCSSLGRLSYVFGGLPMIQHALPEFRRNLFRISPEFTGFQRSSPEIQRKFPGFLPEYRIGAPKQRDDHNSAFQLCSSSSQTRNIDLAIDHHLLGGTTCLALLV